MTAVTAGRSLTGRLLTVLGALLWVVQGFLPMVSVGTFSTSSTLDLARIALAGTMGSLLPPVVAAALLVVPAAAVALLALAPWIHPAARVARVVITLLGVLAVVAQVLAVLGTDWGRIGSGAACALVGALLAVPGAAVACVPVAPSASPARPPTPDAAAPVPASTQTR